MNWVLTVVLTIVTYTLYSFFGLRVGASDTALRAALAPVSDLLNFGLIMSGTVGLGLALFFGGRVTEFAFTIVIALGLVVSFVFSIVVGGASVTATHGVGLVLVMAGVALLR